MITTQVNPSWLEPSAYVDFLNSGFPGQWDRASFDFYVRRAFSGQPSDIGIRAEGERILAGVSYCYRELRVGDHPPIKVCVMSAGTTRREARGQGHYVELLHTGVQLCRLKGCAALMGFVTRDNASGRGLKRLGAHAIPSFYLVSGARRLAARRALPDRVRSVNPGDALAWRGNVGLGRTNKARSDVHFHYADPQDWLAQFVRRPRSVRAIRVAHDSLALLETVGATDRLQWLGCPHEKAVDTIGVLAAASAAQQRRFFMYTLDPLLARAANRVGLATRPGFVMLLPIDSSRVDWGAVAQSAWHVQSGDRI
jgi:hypothetical protein